MSPAEAGRAELVWPGKRAPESIPAARLSPGERHGPPADPDGAWRNRLLAGDNLGVLAALAAEMAGAVALAYLDPPFFTGALRAGPAPDGPSFPDRWAGEGEYLQFMYERLLALRPLLAPTGSLVLHSDPRMDWALRCLAQEVFGRERVINQIIWHYTGGGRSRRYFSRKHDVLLWVAMGPRWTFNVDAVRQPYRATSGYARAGITARSGKHYAPHPLGTPADDVWDLPILNPLSAERVGYPTQKPEALLARLVAATTLPGELVLDPFAGSGTGLVAAERLGRRWLGCDRSEAAIRVSVARLLALPAASPFEVWRAEA